MRPEGVTQVLLAGSRRYCSVRAEIEMFHVSLGILARFLLEYAMFGSRETQPTTDGSYVWRRNTGVGDYSTVAAGHQSENSRTSGYCTGTRPTFDDYGTRVHKYTLSTPTISALSRVKI